MITSSSMETLVNVIFSEQYHLMIWHFLAQVSKTHSLDGKGFGKEFAISSQTKLTWAAVPIRVFTDLTLTLIVITK